MRRASSVLFLLAVGLVLFGLAPSSVWADHGEVAEVYEYVDLENPPLPIGTILKVGGDGYLTWEERIGDGYVPHSVRFRHMGLKVYPYALDKWEGYVRAPVYRERLVLIRYEDQGLTGRSDDGIGDTVVFRPYVGYENSYIERYQYFPIDAPPIEAGTVGEVVGIKNTFRDEERYILLRVETRVGNMYTARYVQLVLEQYWYASFGDRVVVRGYVDGYNRTEEDGVVDYVHLVKYERWTSEDLALIEVAEEFYQDLAANNLVFAAHYGDGGRASYLVNGEPAEPGPWGDTYYVPSDGATITAYWPTWPYEEDGMYVFFETYVRPGDVADGRGALTYPASQMSPRKIGNRLGYMAPQWQPRKAVPGVLPARTDSGAEATLARLGFHGNDNETFEGYRLHVYDWLTPPGLTVVRWEQVEQAILAGQPVLVPVAVSTANFPDFYWPNLDPAEEATNRGVRWGLEWGVPFLFVPEEMLSSEEPFTWEGIEVYKMEMPTPGEVILYKAVLAN